MDLLTEKYAGARAGPTTTRFVLCALSPLHPFCAALAREEPSAKDFISLGDRECYAAEAITDATCVIGMGKRF